MKTVPVMAALLMGLTVAAQAGAQSRFGYGGGYTDGYYRDSGRRYGIDPYQNSQFGYGTGRFGFGDSRFGEGSTRFGQQYSPFGEQLSSYGEQYNVYGGQVPRDWTPTNPAYNPVLSAAVLPVRPPQEPAALAAPLAPTAPPQAPATRPALPASNARGAAAGRPLPPAAGSPTSRGAE